MQKHAMNFRFGQDSLLALELLETELKLTKTAIVESAVQAYAKKRLSQKNDLLAYAGCLTSETADDILITIRSNRHNKRKAPTL